MGGPAIAICLACRLSASIVTYGGWGSGKSYTLGSLEPQQLTLSPNAANANAGVILRWVAAAYRTARAPITASRCSCMCILSQPDPPGFSCFLNAQVPAAAV